MAAGLQPVAPLPQIKVPRRYRRAFDRLSGPRTPPYRALVLAGVCVAFALGFVLGRLGGAGAGQPTVSALPPVAPLTGQDISGSAAYLRWSATSEPLAAIVSHDLFSGELRSLARLSAPPVLSDESDTRMVSFGSSVAVVLGEGDEAFVAAWLDGLPVGWIKGTDVAWESPDRLLVRSLDGRLRRWHVERDEVATVELDGRWEALLQTARGAAVVGPTHVAMSTQASFEQTIAVPESGSVLAVSQDGSRALVSTPDGVGLWDGSELTRIDVEGFEARAASFEASGERMAITGSHEGGLTLAIVDAAGNAALKPVGADEGCSAPPAWDALGRWIYVSSGDGVLHALESGGGRTDSVRTRSVGCGLAWLG